MSGLKIKTAWTINVVSIADFKAFARIDSSDSTENSLIESLIFVAQDLAEQFMNRAITFQVLQLFLDRLPFYSDARIQEGIYTAPDITYNSNYIVLPKPNLIEIVAVKYYSDDNTATTFATENYFVDTTSEQGRVVLRSGKSWPTTTELRDANAYEVEYKAGYGNNNGDTASLVPRNITNAIKMLALHLYENRDVVTSMTVNTIPVTVGTLLSDYKVRRLNNILGG